MSDKRPSTTVTEEARRAVLPANHKDCDPDECYRAGWVQDVLDALSKAGFTLTRCTCGEEGRHPRLHDDTCQTYLDWLADAPVGKGS